MVRTVEKVNAEIELWTGSAVPEIRRLPSDITRRSERELELDVRWLSPLLGAGADVPVVVGAAVGPLALLGEARTIVWGVAKRLGLPHPILGGRYRGIEVSFSMRARPPLRIDRETRRAARPQKK